MKAKTAIKNKNAMVGYARTPVYFGRKWKKVRFAADIITCCKSQHCKKCHSSVRILRVSAHLH